MSVNIIENGELKKLAAGGSRQRTVGTEFKPSAKQGNYRGI